VLAEFLFDDKGEMIRIDMSEQMERHSVSRLIGVLPATSANDEGDPLSEHAAALTESAKEYIRNQGYDPVYGARPLKRAIQHHLLDPLSLELLDGTFKDGDVITADLENGAMVFRV
jgi:ATP-dependent Clp protease ATP-binding subunit ClpA